MCEKEEVDGGVPKGFDASLECTRLHAAYLAWLVKPAEKDLYFSVLAAMEAELNADVFVYIPVRTAMPARVTKGGSIEWNVVETSMGKLLSVFTSRAEAEKHPAPASIGVKLRAAFKTALSNGDLSGIVLNPSDGCRGLPIERRNLEVMASRLRGGSGQVPQLHPGVVSHAVYRLWEIAVGVPTAVYDVSSEVEKLGGLGKLLKPLVDKWQAKMSSSAGEFADPMDCVKAALKDVISSGFVFGAMALKNPDKALQVDVEKCIAAIPDLRGDIDQNLDEYLILISDAIRAGLKEPNEAHVQLMVAGNLPIISFGAFNFGLGWGMAKDAESQGVMELAELRDRQQAWIEQFKQRIAEKLQKRKAEKADEDVK